MRLQIWVGDEGPTDLDLKDGDIFAVHPNSWVPGTQELIKYLIVETAEYGGVQAELVKPEYNVGSPDPVIRHARKYFVPYWLTLTPDELAIVRNKDTGSFPVVTGDRFTVWDITRK